MVFIGEKSSKHRVNAYILKYMSMAYYIVFIWIKGRDGTRGKVTGNFLVNALRAFHRFNRRYHAKNNNKRIKIIKIKSAAKGIQLVFCRHLVKDYEHWALSTLFSVGFLNHICCFSIKKLVNSLHNTG